MVSVSPAATFRAVPTDSRRAAVDERLERLRAAYREAFPPKRDGGCGLWILEEPERPFLEAVIGIESTAHERACLDDSFLVLASGGAGDAEYAERLGAEFTQTLLHEEETLRALRVGSAAWERPPRTRSLTEVLAYIAGVTRQLPGAASRAVVFLNPSTVTDVEAYAGEIAALLSGGLPERFILLLVDAPYGALRKALGKRADLGIAELRPRLDMRDLHRAMVTEHGGAVKDPAARFQLLFIDISEHGSKKAFARMREAGDEAEALCVAGGAPWVHLSVAALLSQAGYYVASAPHRDLAIECYRKAVERSRAAETAGNEMAPALLTQSYLGLASAYVHLGRYGEAIPHYTSCADYATASANTRSLELEARRMVGSCLQELGRAREAYEAYEHTLQVAAELEHEARRRSTLPYLGAEMIDLARGLGRRGEVARIEERMVELFGEDWRAHIDPNFRKHGDR